MTWTKQDLIHQAFEEIGVAAYTFDLSADQLQSALRQLDAMMAAWNARGLRLGYPSPSTTGGSALTDSSGLSDLAVEAVYMNLALRLAPPLGKTVSPELKANAKQSLDALFARAAVPPERQLPADVPAGAGNKRWRSGGSPFLDDPVDTLNVGPDGDLEVQ
jgi:hypothetical protein